MAPVKKPATYADLEALPEHLVGEIINGELVVSPRPRPQHAVAASRIVMDVGGPFDRGRGGPGGWWILAEPELHLDGHVLVPDVAGWRRERLPDMPAEAQGISMPPDWVCEVLSPSTVKIDRGRKLVIYVHCAVDWAWLVDPAMRMLEVYHRVRANFEYVGAYTDDARARVPPFDAIELELSAWWLPRPPGAAAEPPIVWTAATFGR